MPLYRTIRLVAQVQPTGCKLGDSWPLGNVLPCGRNSVIRHLDHGVRLAFGTNWEVAPLDPLLTIYTVTRATLDGKNPNGWFPQQKLSVAEAIEAYTMGTAYAEFQEKEKGGDHSREIAGIWFFSAKTSCLLHPRKFRRSGCENVRRLRASL